MIFVLLVNTRLGGLYNARMRFAASHLLKHGDTALQL